MANKLKNMRLTSVDMVRNGANQEADICLFKSADPTDEPTERETNIFKRFLNWLRENPTEGENEPTAPVEKADEQPDLADIYKSAITESLQSIAADDNLTATEKNDMIAKSLEEYHEAMVELLSVEKAEEDLSYLLEGLEKSDSEEEEWDEEEEEEVEKINHNHDALGRFASSPGGGGGSLKGSDVRSFGVPGCSSSYYMNKKERKLAQTIIDNEELDLEIRDGKDAYGNPSTSFHGTREDYQSFKEMWQMVAPSELGKSADIDEIEEV